MTSPGRPLVLVDCDPGHDDAVALVVAAHFCDLVGITTVGGNAPLADVTANALLTCQLFGIDVDVHPGSPRPLVAEPLHAPEIHGVKGFDGPSLPMLDRSAASVGAVEFIIETVRSTEGLWLVPLGPLTNIALALRSAPDLADRVAGISFMGGSAGNGNRTATAEFNVLVDPEAAHVVLTSGARVHMAGLDLTAQLLVDDELVADVQALSVDGSNPGAEVLADLMASYLDAVEGLNGRRAGALHDPCAVLAVSHPSVVSSTLRPVAVELDGSLSRGMTIVDRRPGPPRSPANVHHGHTLDSVAARAAVIEAIDQRGRS